MGYSLGKEFILLTPKCNEDMLFDPLLVNYFLEIMEVLGSLTILREGFTKKSRKKSGVLPNLPRKNPTFPQKRKFGVIFYS